MNTDGQGFDADIKGRRPTAKQLPGAVREALPHPNPLPFWR
jgi:hypothetical protein